MKMTRRAHRSPRTTPLLVLATALLVLMFALGPAAAQAAPPEPTVDLEELQALLDASPSGLDGHFSTVVGGGAGGQDPVDIPMTVLAIVGGAGPDGALILFQADMSDPVMVQIGNIALGMSGSPLYVDDAGTDKLIGALSYGDWFTTGGLALATPIEYMAAIETRFPIIDTVTSSSTRSARDEGGAVPEVVGTADDIRIATLPEPVPTDDGGVERLVVADDADTAEDAARPDGTAVFAPLSPLQVGGLAANTPAYERLAQKLEGRGHSLLDAHGAGAGGWDPDYSTDLVPGAACAAMYTRGDLWAGSIGTVTYTDGDVLLAFGHPFDWTGISSLYLDNAWIDGIWSSSMESYKLGSPGAVRGTVTQDRGAGVGARLDEDPEEVPVTASATVEVAGTQTASSETWMTRWMADGIWGAWLADSAALVPVYKASDVYELPGSAETTTVVRVRDESGEYTVTRQNLWSDLYDVLWYSTYDVSTIVGALTANVGGTAPAEIVSVDFDAQISDEQRGAQILGLSVPGGLRRGANTVLVRLLPYGSTEEVTVPVTLTIPAKASINGMIWAWASQEWGWDYWDDEWYDDYAADRVVPAGPNGWTSDQRPLAASTNATLPEIVDELNEMPDNSSVELAFYSSSPTVYGQADTDYFLSGEAEAETTRMWAFLWPKTITYGRGHPMLYGYLSDVDGESTLSVFKQTAGTTTWKLVRDDVPIEIEDGEAVFYTPLPRPSRTTRYKAVWGGDEYYLGCTDTVRLKVRARTTISGWSLRSGAVRVKVRVAPNQAGRMVAIEAKVGKRWKRKALVKLNSKSVRTWTWHPKAGTYRVRARFLGNSRNAASTSRAITLRVR